MSDAELRTILTRCLGADVLNRRGQILYSGIDTLEPGTAYFLGFNPAADGTNPILRDVPLSNLNWSAYKEQCWYHPDCGLSTGCAKAGQARHQRNVLQIMSELGLAPERTLAANLIFVEGETAREMCMRNEWKDLLCRCWGVHKKLLAQVMPKYIMCLGNGEKHSVFSVLREIAKDRKEMPTSGARKHFIGTFDLGDGVALLARVIGVGHPSWPWPKYATGLRGFVESE